MNDLDALTAYLTSFVDELAYNQILDVVVSPGSRSTPLAMLFAEHPKIKIHLNVDERSAAFFALGLAKAKKRPVALVCTSGTAAANFYPAVIEAFYARVPLLVLTADRPHELRDVGAPQTIDQIHLYGNQVKWFVEMSTPEKSESMINYVRTIAARAVATSSKQPAGPVHLNFPIREPLIPDMANVAQYQKTGEVTSVQVEQGTLTLSPSQTETIRKKLETAKRGIIICGELSTNEAKEEIVQFAKSLGFPVLADPLSQLRSGAHNKDVIIDTYDTVLRFDIAKQELKPDLIVRFGSMPVSKSLLLFLKEQKDAVHITVDGGAGWREPAGLATDMVYCDESTFCKSISVQGCNRQKWLHKWQSVNEATKNALLSVRDDSDLSEGKLFSVLQDLMPEESTLFVGNSMPIRDLDTFFSSNSKEITIHANRGANGIDGIVSTALGVSTVAKNTVLTIGDLSFYHDMNGLLAGKLQGQNLTIVVINNDGGGIFSFLPQAKEETYFEQLFGTPHGLDFRHAAMLYEATYHKVGHWDGFNEAFVESFERPGLKIIEVPTERTSNVVKHRELWKFVSQEIDAVLKVNQ